MRINNLLATAFIVLLLAACSKSGNSPNAAADYVFTNGKVYTVNPDQEWAQAVAVRGDTIVYVGDSDSAKAFVGEKTESSCRQLPCRQNISSTLL
jgi:hypothetical protein